MTSRTGWITLGITAVVCILFYFLSPIIAPFLFAALVAYLVKPVVTYLMRLKIPRTLSVIITFLFLLISTILILLLFVPLLQKQIILFLEKFPEWLDWLQLEIVPKIGAWFGISNGFDVNQIKEAFNGNWQQIGSVAGVVWLTLARSGLALFEFVVKFMIFCIVTFYLLRDWDKVLTELKSYLPRASRTTVTRFFKECDQVLGAFFRGQLSVMLVLAIFYTLSLWFMGLDLALLIGVFVGLISFIPYLGAILGVVVACLAAWFQFHGWLQLIYVLVIFLLGHILENGILTPYLVGDRLGLHPVAVIFAVLAGGQLFGFMGALFALPVAAVLVVLLRDLRREYIEP